jgi:hypothetical protein
MKALGFGLVFGAVVIVSACSSATPTSDCNEAASVYCQHQFKCAATAASQQFGTQANCETQVEALLQCAALVCPANTTYHNDKVQACINAVNGQSCSDTTNPPACQGFSTSTVCY